MGGRGRGGRRTRELFVKLGNRAMGDEAGRNGRDMDEEEEAE